jgi:hypothetical protein
VGGDYLRFDRPELVDDHLIIRAVDHTAHGYRRQCHLSPLGYLYEVPDADAPEHDLRLAAGHYDQANLVWVFSGEVPGIMGLTESFGPAPESPGRFVSKEVQQ